MFRSSSLKVKRKALQTPTSKGHRMWMMLPDSRLRRNNRYREIIWLVGPLKNKAGPRGMWVGTRGALGSCWPGRCAQFLHPPRLSLGAGHIGVLQSSSRALVISTLFSTNITLEIKCLLKRGLQLHLDRSSTAGIRKGPVTSALSSTAGSKWLKKQIEMANVFLPWLSHDEIHAPQKRHRQVSKQRRYQRRPAVHIWYSTEQPIYLSCILNNCVIIWLISFCGLGETGTESGMYKASA